MKRYLKRVHYGFSILLSVLLIGGCSVSVNESMLVSPSAEINKDNLNALYEVGYTQSMIKTQSGDSLFSLTRKTEGADITLLVLHGNALNISLQPWYGILNSLASLPVNVVAIDYRGFGLSSGVASFSNMKVDAEQALASISSDQKVVLYGLSLGSVMALDVADKQNVKGVILEGGITTLDEMVTVVKERNNFGSMVEVDLEKSIQFDNLAVLKGLNKPVLVIHGKLDENIPHRMGEELYKAASHPWKEFVSFENGHHCDAFRQDENRYLNSIQSIFSAV